MNIKIEDSKLFQELLHATFFKIEVGSRLYGIKNEDSDTDILCIYNDSNSTSLVNTIHHQLQYKDKETNTDYIFTTLPNFIRNIQTGDSTINYEVLFTEELKNSDLGFLYEMRHWFQTYNVIKAYLGFAKRDIKQSLQSQFNPHKKLSHAARSVIAAHMILNGSSYVNDLSNSNLAKIDAKQKLFIKSLKNGEFEESSRDEVRTNLYAKIEELRDELEHKLNKKSIWRYFCPLRHRDLDAKVCEFLSISNLESPRIAYMDIYNALETGINYQKDNV